MDGRLTRTNCDEAGDYVVPYVLSPRDLVSRPDNMDETVLSSSVPKSLSPTGSAQARTDLSPLTNGNWVIHVEYSCLLHPPFLAKIGYIPLFKASNARVLDEISSGLARMVPKSI